MADYVNDQSGLGALAAGIQGFSDAFVKGRDLKYKDMEREAQLAAMKSKLERDKFADAVSAHKERINYDPSTNTITDLPETPREQNAAMLSGKEKGINVAYDDEGKRSLTYDPNSPQMVAARTRQDLGGQRLDIQRQRLGNTLDTTASKTGRDIEEDSIMKDLTNSKQSLARGKSLLNGKQPLTYNNLNAVQQDVINAMTKGSQSSEGKVNREMQESWIGRWNNVMAKSGKYGPNNDIRKQDPGLYKQIQGLLQEVDSSISQNMATRFNNLASSYGESSNEKVKNVINKKRAQYAPEQAPEGLVQSQPGLVGAQPGLVQQDAGPQSTGQDQNIVNYAKSNGLDYSHAEAILRARGYGK